MPKQKTHSGASKRFRVTKTGKLMRRKGGAGHLMTSKSGKRRRHLKGVTKVSGKKSKTIRQMLSS